MAKNGFDDLGWESLDFMEEVQTTDEQKKRILYMQKCLTLQKDRLFYRI